MRAEEITEGFFEVFPPNGGRHLAKVAAATHKRQAGIRLERPGVTTKRLTLSQAIDWRFEPVMPPGELPTPITNIEPTSSGIYWMHSIRNRRLNGWFLVKVVKQEAGLISRELNQIYIPDVPVAHDLGSDGYRGYPRQMLDRGVWSWGPEVTLS